MKIIKPGREQKGWAKKFTCTGNGNNGGGCGALLLVEQEDVFLTSSSCRDETDYFSTFECPSCKVLTDIPKTVQLPFVARPRGNNLGAR